MYVMYLFSMEVIDMGANDVTAAEIEKYKLVRSAEKQFVQQLRSLVDELLARVGQDSDVAKRMVRFLKNV